MEPYKKYENTYLEVGENFPDVFPMKTRKTLRQLGCLILISAAEFSAMAQLASDSGDETLTSQSESEPCDRLPPAWPKRSFMPAETVTKSARLPRIRLAKTPPACKIPTPVVIKDSFHWTT